MCGLLAAALPLSGASALLPGVCFETMAATLRTRIGAIKLVLGDVAGTERHRTMSLTQSKALEEEILMAVRAGSISTAD